MSQVQPSFFSIWPSAASRRRPSLTYVLLMIPVAGFQRDGLEGFSKFAQLTVQIQSHRCFMEEVRRKMSNHPENIWENTKAKIFVQNAVIVIAR